MNNDSTTAGTISPTDLFLSQLRSQTAIAHQNLESLPVSMAILSPNITKESYAHYLNLMHDVVSDTETSIFPMLHNIIPDLNDRRKLSAIEADLAVAGVKKSALKTVFNQPEDFSTAFALGILYVVEGSSLGGRFILKNITTALGFDENNGAKYFAGYGNKTGSHWKNFLHSLTEYEAENNCGEEIIAGAGFAFGAIHEHFAAHPQA